MGREKKLLKNTFIIAIGTVLTKLTTFITLPIYTKYLTKQEYGSYDLIMTIISLIIPIITLQIHLAVFRQIMDEDSEDEKKKTISTAFFFMGFTSLITVILTFFTFKTLDLYIKIAIAIYFVLDTFLQGILYTLRGLGQNKKYAIGSVISSILNVILIVAFIVYLKLGFMGLMLSLIVSTAVAMIYIIFSSKLYKYTSIKCIEINRLKQLLKYSIPMVPNSISWWILNVSDRLVISAVLGIEANAIYAAANKIPSIYNLLYNAFNLSWQESASKANKDKDVSEYYSKIFNTLFYLLLSGLMILISITPILFKILIDESYMESFYQMPIIYIGLFFSSIASFLGGIYVALKVTKKLAKTAIFAAIINFLINIMLVKEIGLYAASISTMISYMAISIYRMIDIKKVISIQFNKAKMAICMILLTISAIMCYINNIYFNIINICYSIIVFIILNKNIITNYARKVMR